MILMPRIEHRRIERLKSNRSIRVQAAEPYTEIAPKQHPRYNDRRSRSRDRRQKSVSVSVDRRRGDRRNAHKRLRPEIKALLENAGGNNAATVKRDGVYIDEDV